ncbi:MAG: aminotransferase class III-fold pyridoxal phosphate-dependent enzyme [Leptospiraceae bacterium]|nr:aminotransferase class III-fold pyridoxal phosphate-dependent enzyme [Leptospiraceae bacterium]
MNSGQELYKKARKLIPGGTQLFSKRPERLLPDHWPVYFKKAKGALVWDMDGKEYLDMTTSGIGSCILGYADPDVENEVLKVIKDGSMSTLNPYEEVELAELLCDLHPWAEMARFSRSGGEALSIAIRIARACTGKDIVAFCGYHGWQDWYLAANLNDNSNLDNHLLPGLSAKGVPRGLTGTIFPFNYNNLEELNEIVSKHGKNLAAIIMEPSRSKGPDPGFLEGVKEIANKTNSVLIFDEVTSGWRAITGGIHLTYGVNPDMAVFAKAMGNGYPMSAVIGTKAVMEAA